MAKEIRYQYRVLVYLKNNVKFGYWVSSPEKAMEHAKRIITEGFQCDLGDGLTWFPTSSIYKVRIPDVQMPKRIPVKEGEFYDAPKSPHEEGLLQP